MTLTIDRRSLIVTGAWGLGGLALPGFAQTPNVTQTRGFTHSVASGEPGAGTMLLWTRYVPADGGPATLRVEVSATRDFARVVAGGAQTTGPWRDHTAKITVDGLRPATAYFFRFVAPDGSFSPVGRTRTLPDGAARSFTIATFSCSNMPFGYFNAYAHAAARQDVDLTVHLGDYFYEYRRGNYPAEAEAVDARWPLPLGEIVALTDYRLRYASYRADPDLQALHAAKPMIVQWDDHESSNDSWEGGAQNHQDGEGEWHVRKAAAMQAYREWMPISDEPWKAYDFGALGTFFRTETRLLHRTRPPEIAGLLRASDPAAALRGFRDGAWMDPAATLLGSDQERWLTHGLARSVRDGRRWQVVGSGVNMGRIMTPGAALGWLDASSAPRSQAYVRAGVAAAKAGLPNNLDNWGGYPVARARLLAAAQRASANLIVLSGDSHNAWAFDLPGERGAAGVEFGGHSVTSPGYESGIRRDPQEVAAAVVAASPELKWADTSQRGYMATVLTPERVRNDWVFMDTIKTRNSTAHVGHSATVARGRNVLG
jgi:alkaline phosphatase D